MKTLLAYTSHLKTLNILANILLMSASLLKKIIEEMT